MYSTEIHEGDCLEIMQEIPTGSVDMVLCDLPYGAVRCKWDNVIPFEPLWEQYRRVTKERAAVVLFAAQPFTTSLISSNRRNFRYCWYWKKNNKTGAPFAHVQPMRCVEDIAVFYKKSPTYNAQGLVALKDPIINKPRAEGVYGAHKNVSVTKYTGWPHHLLEFANEVQNNRNRLHPTQKPVKLLEYLIKTYTNPGEVVLDNCMGSGSTGVACLNTGRRFIGIEKDPHYFEIAKKRIKAEAENTAAHV